VYFFRFGRFGVFFFHHFTSFHFGSVRSSRHSLSATFVAFHSQFVLLPDSPPELRGRHSLVAVHISKAHTYRWIALSFAQRMFVYLDPMLRAIFFAVLRLIAQVLSIFFPLDCPSLQSIWLHHIFSLRCSNFPILQGCWLIHNFASGFAVNQPVLTFSVANIYSRLILSAEMSTGSAGVYSGLTDPAIITIFVLSALSDVVASTYCT